MRSSNLRNGRITLVDGSNGFEGIDEEHEDNADTEYLHATTGEVEHHELHWELFCGAYCLVPSLLDFESVLGRDHGHRIALGSLQGVRQKQSAKTWPTSLDAAAKPGGGGRVDLLKLESGDESEGE
jgi:hypothetical protein